VQNFLSLDKKEGISLPIIEPFLKLSLLNHPQGFDKVYLIATNQTLEDAGARNWQNDTCYLAVLIQKMLSSRKKEGNKLYPKIEIIEVKENVIYLDSIFSWFKRQFSSKKFAELDTADQIHLFNQGGIDAINYGLMLLALYTYGSKVNLYNVNEQLKVCTPLEFQEQFGYEQEKRQLFQSLDRCDYASAKDMDIPDNVKHLCAYAEARVNFDFDVAIQKLGLLDTSLRSFRDKAIGEIRQVQENEQSLTLELFWNAQIKLDMEAYVDFVQRYFRIVEQIAKDNALKHLDFDFKFNTWHKDFSLYLDTPGNESFKQHINSQTINGASLDCKNANIAVFSAILSFFDPIMLDFIQSLKPLSQLRNQGIGAHGFEPIGKRQILEKLKTDEQGLEKLMLETGKLVGATTNPFEQINEAIKANLVKNI
jgi:hypothetical protein